MNTQQSDDLNRVLEKICEVAEKSAGGDYVYRGEPACYPKVSSTLYREYEKEIEAENFEIDVVQKEILDEARKYIRETADDLEILTELQHHGGKTNLIDFTTDYLIALFFSCDGEHDKAGRVILLEKESDDYKVEKPPKTINRVESQKSIFVQASEGFVEPDKVVTVPQDLKQAMLNYLQKHHDISTETIYNDLHGFITNRSIHESAYTLFHKGLTCQNRGDSAKTRAEKQVWYDKAVGHYTQALALKPDLHAAYYNSGTAYLQKGELDNAIKDLNKAIEIKPDFAEAYNNRGTAYEKKGELDNAFNDFTTAIEIKPVYAEAYNNRGTAYEKKGELDNAFNDFTTAIEIKPVYAEAYSNRGTAYLQKGDFDNAIKDFTTAIEIKPVYAEAYNNRGTAYEKKGELDNAFNDFTTAIEIKPDDAKAYSNRGATYAKKGELDNALKDLTTAIEIKPVYATAYSNRGAVYAKKGELDNALKDLTTAIEIKPDFAEAYYSRGEAWMRRSEWDKAKADLTVAKDLGLDVIALFHYDYENVADFEQKNGVTVPADIKEMLTQR